MRNIIAALALAALTFSGVSYAGETPSAPGAKSYFVNLKNGDVVTSPVKVVFGLSGMGVAPAGTEKEGTGHHHIFLNRPALGKGETGGEELVESIISDEQHIHFGKGQTETTLELSPGTHTLQLVLADQNHIPHNPPVASEVITITVK